MIGSLASVPLPNGDPGPGPLSLDPLQVRLFTQWRIEVPIMPWPRPPGRVLRVSSQAYNHADQYGLLAEALRALLG
jgi:isopenicillin-N epimerase